MLFVLIPWLAGIAIVDFAKRRVSNQWLLAGALVAIGTLARDGSPLDVTWQQALIGGIGAFVVLLGFYALGVMGAGDVKFAGVLGLWVGGPALVPIATGAGLLAGGHALFCLARRHGPRSMGRGDEGHVPAGEGTRASASNGAPVTTGGIPYAGYLAVMALLWLAWRAIPTTP